MICHENGLLIYCTTVSGSKKSPSRSGICSPQGNKTPVRNTHSGMIFLMRRSRARVVSGWPSGRGPTLKNYESWRKEVYSVTRNGSVANSFCARFIPGTNNQDGSSTDSGGSLFAGNSVTAAHFLRHVKTHRAALGSVVER